MIGERLQGVKRKLHDQDGDLQVRCIQRQTIFNISISKLQKNSCAPEPMLCRAVLIANTVRLIQRDIEEENKNLGIVATSAHDNDETGETNEPRVPNHLQQHRSDTRSRNSVEHFQVPRIFEEELNLLGDKITKDLEIGVQRNVLPQERPHSTTNQTIASKQPSDCEVSNVSELNGQAKETPKIEDIDREMTCGSLFSLELTEELKFSDVDVSLYDFDVPSFSVDMDEFCGALSVSNICSLPSRCSESMKLERKNEHAFDDLDQVMQILVGS